MIFHYKGRRIVLVEKGTGDMSPDSEDFPIAIFDKRISATVGGCKKLNTGKFEGYVSCGMTALGVCGRDARELAADAYRAILESEKY